MSTTTTQLNKPTEQHAPSEAPKSQHKDPLVLKGVLDQYKSFDVTPVIGREFPDVKLKDWLDGPNADDLLRDLAITSVYIHGDRAGRILTCFKSRSAGSCSSASRTSSTTRLRNA